MHNAAYRGTNEAFIRAHIDSPFVILRRSDRKHRASFVDLKESLKDQHSRLSQPLELLMEQFTALQQRCSETDVALEKVVSRHHGYLIHEASDGGSLSFPVILQDVCY